jgi:hypothetical protein
MPNPNTDEIVAELMAAVVALSKIILSYHEMSVPMRAANLTVIRRAVETLSD